MLVDFCEVCVNYRAQNWKTSVNYITLPSFLIFFILINQSMNRFFLIVGVVLVPIMASATDVAADSAKWLENVTVTAIKQSSDLSLTPGSVTTLNPRQVRLWGVESMRGISEIAPNFYSPDYGSRMTSSIYVRGIGARMDQSAIGLSVDNMTFLNKDAFDFDMIDISHVEVLRGAQSTLYGRNTMMGQVNIYTISPMDYQGSRVMARFGNGPTAKLGISHYQKFNPSLAMAFVGSIDYSDGFFRNIEKDVKVDVEKALAFRWKTQWQASEHLAVDNVASFSMSRQSGYPYELLGSDIVNYNDTCFYRRDLLTDALTVKWSGEDFSISSISSVQYLNDNLTLDQDFQPASYFTLTQKRKEWSVTQDFVARGQKNNYNWIAGLFGFYKSSSMEAPVTLKEDGISGMITDRVNKNDRIPIRLECGDSQIALESLFDAPVWGVALYHQSTLDVGRVNLALGMRLDYESTKLDYTSLCSTQFSAYMKSGMPPRPIGVYPIEIDDKDVLEDDFLEFVPKLTVSYQLPMESKSTIYASVGKGYKSGGYNNQMFSEVLQQKMQQALMANMPSMGGGAQAEINVDEIVSYRPEMSWNYELGAHISCADNRVMTDLALFYIDCRDQQLTMFPPGQTTGRITTNAGKTRSFGAEVQIKYNPTLNWSFNASYGYTNAKFVEFVNGNNDYKGNYVPYAPSNTLFASVAYTHSIGEDWRMAYNLNCRTVGPIYWDESNTVKQSMYSLLGASVVASWKNLSLEAWMKNITNTDYDTFYFRSMQKDFLQRGNPRTFGLTLRVAFDAPSKE